MSGRRGAGQGLAGVLAAAVEAQDCLLVAASDDPLVGEARARVPDRLVPVDGEGVRAAVAAGVALAGRRVVVLAGEVPARLPVADLPAGGAIVVVTRDARVAGACWGAGWTLVQPAWSSDVPALLGGALAVGGTAVVVHLPSAANLVPAPGHPPRFGVPRVLCEGTAGLLAASGAAAVARLVEVARLLSERGVRVRALELHTAAPGEGPGPAASDGMLFVADRPADDTACDAGRWPPALRYVRVPADPSVAMEAVAAHLRARR